MLPKEKRNLISYNSSSAGYVCAQISCIFSRMETKSAKASGLFPGLRSSAAGCSVAVKKVPFFSVQVPCSFITLKSGRIIRWAAIRPRHTTILG